MKFDTTKFDVKTYHKILDRGLSQGLGSRDAMVCIEAAICQTLGLPHGDDPQCVTPAVRAYKIALNDSPWSSPQARAAGLRDLGLAQLGSLGVVDGGEFSRRLAEKTIRVLIPQLFRLVFPKNSACLTAADRCEAQGTAAAAVGAGAAAAEAAWAAAAGAGAAGWAAAGAAGWAAAAAAARAAEAATEAAEAAEAAAGAAAARAAEAARAAAARAAAAEAATAAEAAWAAAGARAAEAAEAARAAAARAAEAAAGEEFLILSGSLALETLRELKSPGCKLL
jgi:hypothetical protein